MEKNKWKNVVRNRDNSSCCRCKRKNSNVVAISTDQQDIYVLNNGITICKECEEEYKSRGNAKSYWLSWDNFVKEEGRTLRKPIK